MKDQCKDARSSEALGMALLLSIGVVLLSACSSERDRVWTELLPRHQRTYVSLWGAMPDAESLADTRRVFDCVWERIEGAGGDPAADARCLQRRNEALAACVAAGGRHDCSEVASAACAMSLSTATMEALPPCRASRHP